MLAAQRRTCRKLAPPIRLNRITFHWTTFLGSRHTPDHKLWLYRYPERSLTPENSQVCACVSVCVRACVLLAVWNGLQWDTPDLTRGGIVEAEGTLREASEADQRTACSRQEAQKGLEQLTQHLDTQGAHVDERRRIWSSCASAC